MKRINKHEYKVDFTEIAGVAIIIALLFVVLALLAAIAI